MSWETLNVWGFNPAYWVGIAITIAIAVWSVAKGSVSRLAYAVRDTTIISDTDPAFSADIKVLFKETLIPRATLSRVSVWNDGNQTIRRADITPKKPLILKVPEGQQILSFSITNMADYANDPEMVRSDDRTLALTFEYLNAKQGFTCDVLHTGTSHNLVMSGVLMTANAPVYSEEPSQSMSTSHFLMVMLVGLALPIFVFHYITTLDLMQWQPLTRLIVIFGSIALMILWLFLVVGFAIYRASVRIYFGPSR